MEGHKGEFIFKKKKRKEMRMNEGKKNKIWIIEEWKEVNVVGRKETMSWLNETVVLQKWLLQKWYFSDFMALFVHSIGGLWARSDSQADSNMSGFRSSEIVMSLRAEDQLLLPKMWEKKEMWVNEKRQEDITGEWKREGNVDVWIKDGRE